MAQQIAQATARAIEVLHFEGADREAVPDPVEQVLIERARQRIRAIHRAAHAYYLPAPDPGSRVSADDLQQALRERR